MDKWRVEGHAEDVPGATTKLGPLPGSPFDLLGSSTKVLVLLPTEHNELTLQWKGPSEVVELVNRMDYKVKVHGKTKVYHANLLKRYFERSDDLTGTSTLQQGLDVASIAVIDPELIEDEADSGDEELLQLRPLQGNETYSDVKVSKKLTSQQKEQLHEVQ